MDNLVPLVITSLENIESGKSIRVSLRELIDKHNLDKEEESRLYYLIFEIYRKLNLIDLYIKTSSSSFSLKKIKKNMRAFLRLATHLIKIEKKSLEEVVKYLEPFYESISDSSLKDLLQLIDDLSEETLYKNRTDFASRLSLDYYLPTWIVRKFIGRWGEIFTEELLSSFEQNPPMYIRVNPFKSTVDEIQDTLKSKGVVFSLVPKIDNLLKIDKTETPIPQLSEFNAGKIVVQQKASALASLILAPQLGEQILDMCASPGGKTSHLAALTGSCDGIVAVDINDDRIRILRKRMEILGLDSIKLIQTDAKELSREINYKFDKILVDPPCSGSGTYSSRPENKWRLKQRDLRWYTNLQTALLDEAAKLLKIGGDIVYSTCSLFSEENQDIVENFLESHKDFKLENQNPVIGFLSELSNGKVQEMFPHIHETEGFFIAKIRKIK